MTPGSKKYQIFVSSTYEDLRVERQEIMHALLELDCIPSGMELFPAADEDQWSLIQGVIDECDYYVLILGGRYGSSGPDGIGYTEKEYRYAQEIGKPIIAFLHKDPDSLPKKQTEQSESGQERFRAFRDLAQKKMCKYWETPKDLGSVVSRSLIMLQRNHPGIGWIRGNMALDKDSALEILDLKKAIEKLKNQLEEARTQAPPGTEELAQGNDLFVIGYTCRSSKDYKKFTWADQNVELDWNTIFYHLSPRLLDEVTSNQIKYFMDNIVRDFECSELEEMETAKGHKFSDFTADQDDVHTVILQLRALGLITRSNKPRSIKDTETYWTLTPYGDGVMNKLRAIKRSDKA